ncbi:hypothetical protein CI610_02397 [invertebrate metagenome]|uniref:DUF2608 domain-containing protein n=1 Tax=invertebrate metagenome TaxID=1711999 RepID=A0A2H9T615_9ZZZZ
MISFYSLFTTFLLCLLLQACTPAAHRIEKSIMAVHTNKTVSNPDRPNEKKAVEKTPKPGHFLTHWLKTIDHPERILLLLDIDDTLITTPPKQWLGRSELFYDYLRREQHRQPQKTQVEIASQIDPLLIAVYERTPSILTDSTLPEAIEQLRKKGIIVLGITSRGEQLWPLTLKQLTQKNIVFSSITTEKQFSNKNKMPITIREGIIFASHGNTKGETVRALLKTSWIKPSIKHIVMIDDQQRHLNSVGDTLVDYPALSFQPILCIFPQTSAPYNASEAEQQLEQFLWQWRNDPVIKKLVQEDLFTRQILNNCSKKSTLSGGQCHHLKQSIHSFKKTDD